MEKNIDFIEHKFNTFLEKNIDREDTHVVKEVIVYKDGTRKPNLRIIKNFKRPFYITKPHFRNHNDKKEFEELSKVQTYSSTQSDLPNNIATKIGMNGYKRNVYRDVLRSPYLYGSDVPSTAILSKSYEDKFGVRFTPFTVAALDIESDIDTKEIYIVSTVFENVIRTAVNRTLLRNYQLTTDEEIKDKINTIFKKHVRKSEKYTLDITIHDNESSCVVEIFKTIHMWKPDFLSIWNVTFDIKMMANALIKNNIEPKTVFSDPNIPHELKQYEFKEGPAKKKKADGTVMQIDVQNRWHVVKITASFYVIDAMCAYSQIRAGAMKVVGGYGLDNIAKKELGKDAGKITFKGLLPDNLAKEEWHRRMSKEHPLEYIVYNMGDNTEMLDLNDVTSDLSVVLPALTGHSHFNYFNSGPSKIVDKLYHEILEDKIVLGTRPYRDDKDKILGLKGWILTLTAPLITREGERVLR